MSRDVTSMTDSSNISTVGVANGGYNNQMDNRPANINTSNTSNQAPSRAGALVKKEKPEGAPKQTRRATKRADRGRPRAVVPLPTNPDGSLNYPIVVGKGTNEVIIENMGRIVWQGRGYHNHRYIFPVGFRSKKQYTSLSDTSKKTYFINEILDGGEQPIFQITLEDMPEKVFRHSSSSGAWELALKGLMELGYNAKTHASGPDMYGLTNLGVIKYIQEMPNAHRCRRYMPLKWIIEDDSLGSPSNGDPSGSKSPGRKKKINNSLYASNHEVLMETLEEAEKAAQSSGSSTARPYTPRKYTKRKASQDQTPAPELMEIEHIPPLALLPSVSETEPAMGHMEGVKHERDQHLGALPVRDEEAIKTTDVAPHTPQSMGRQEQYFSGMSHDQENKISIHRYDHSYGQPLMEP
ncbi:hypothetical protein BCR41DRAFT_177842 [Lobosporangium transversale]|uniref:F/Y rich C-terminus-domain-containing protein n=1 Tax=Lobosporangium transversale TaxID=64571 RepID=A0A1Y2GX70_9FUNG|nr:hypothetical protein BCR41DRAFT_177842 [Lobosporangium transversale]ORZ26877.1 hypothetical protein BCR41DRAFT_177842 [Lobosporangium transversale]|eukprot:XP_021884624.1 hypothetical protein BCR41DRAFT_177842 [Lobosporangium transversale]